jgi:AMME syndrome candidate gene 1 protein
MATVEHCLYCFESLASHLQKRKGGKLEDIKQSWAEYIKTADSDTGGSSKNGSLAKRLPALQRLASSPSGSSSPSSLSSVSIGADTPGTSISSATEQPVVTESPLFVTWNTIQSGHRSLRGCIGTFESQKLETGLASYALTSALHDMRFPPVDRDELSELEVSVTLLTDFEECDDPMDWTLGVHGLRINFFYHGKRYGSCYLPDVASEQGWTKEETIVSLMRKAGWMGRKDKWRDIELQCTRYQGKVESLEYSEYKAWLEWSKNNSSK